jgi:hypothetical protein
VARLLLLGLFPILIALPAGAQSARGPEDPRYYLGASLAEVIAWFGAPESVFSARGGEAWQDDVVFVYPEADIYFFQNRVWQVGVTTAYGVSSGAEKEAVTAVFGSSRAEIRYGENQGDAWVFRLQARAWPISLRVNFVPKGQTGEGTVSRFYIFRADF